MRTKVVSTLIIISFLNIVIVVNPQCAIFPSEIQKDFTGVAFSESQTSYLHVDGTIYIYTTPQKCSERVQKRNRTGESIPLEYLETCHRYHDVWLNNSKKPMLTLLNEFDVEDHEHMDKLERFKKFISFDIKH